VRALPWVLVCRIVACTYSRQVFRFAPPSHSPFNSPPTQARLPAGYGDSQPLVRYLRLGYHTVEWYLPGRCVAFFTGVIILFLEFRFRPNVVWLATSSDLQVNCHRGKFIHGRQPRHQPTGIQRVGPSLQTLLFLALTCELCTA
jgi:hypothetical protein